MGLFDKLRIKKCSVLNSIRIVNEGDLKDIQEEFEAISDNHTKNLYYGWFLDRFPNRKYIDRVRYATMEVLYEGFDSDYTRFLLKINSEYPNAFGLQCINKLYLDSKIDLSNPCWNNPSVYIEHAGKGKTIFRKDGDEYIGEYQNSFEVSRNAIWKKINYIALVSLPKNIKEWREIVPEFGIDALINKKNGDFYGLETIEQIINGWEEKNKD